MAKFMYIKITKKAYINILIIPLFFISYLLGCLNILLFSFLTAFFHELCHIIMIFLTGSGFKKIIIEPFGMTAQINESSFLNSGKEMLVSSVGPLFNIITAYILSLTPQFSFRDYLIILNLSIGIFNLIPALPLDGGRFLRAYLSLKFGVLRAYNFMIDLSRIITILLFVSGALIVVFSPFNFNLILISVFLLSNLCTERSILTRVILKDILSAKSSAENKVQKNTKVITVSADAPLRLILKHLSFDYFLDIFIAEKSGKIGYITTETEIVNYLLSNSIRAKFKDLYN